MQSPRCLLLATTIVLASLVLRAQRKRKPHVDQSEIASEASSLDVGEASRAFLNFVLLPLWMLPGLGDYFCHRSSHIERRSGTHESLTHLLMISSTGAGIGVGLLFEINELALAIMIASALSHEAVVLWDVGYAAKLRPPSATEQHMHSFLEVLPFTALAFTMCTNPQAVAALALRGRRSRRFRLEPKRHPAPPLYLAGISLLATCLLFIPYTEEFIRCYRIDRTLLPHERPIENAGDASA
jgi:hypothetical protein